MENKDWKDVLRNAYEKGDRQDNRIDPGRQKKMSRIQYKRRKIEKEIKKLLKKSKIKFTEIKEIHDKYQIKVFVGKDKK